MINRAVIAALTLLLSTPLALAQQQDSEAHHPAGAPTADTAGSSSPPAEPAPATTPMESVMAQKLEEMQSHWDKMLQTQDPAERQKLMEEHRQEMQELHAMMRGAQGGQGMGMMQGGQGMGMMQGGQGMMGGGQGMMGGGRGMMGGGQGMMGGGRGMMGGGQGMMGGGQGMGMMHGGQGMGMMHGGQGMGMMHGGQGMMGGRGMGNMDGCRREKQYHQQVERRLEVIQKLLEQVLENQIKS